VFSRAIKIEGGRVTINIFDEWRRVFLLLTSGIINLISILLSHIIPLLIGGSMSIMSMRSRMAQERRKVEA
jgi:hypothetical protein